MNNKIYEFTAKIKKVPDIDGAYIEFPYDIRKEFGKGRIKVYAEFDGKPYNGSFVNMGLKKNISNANEEYNNLVKTNFLLSVRYGYPYLICLF